MAKVAIVTLGCPKNQVDSENLIQSLEQEGIPITYSPGDARIILVNTCGFIEQAKEESIDEIINLIRYRKKGKKLIVFGCLAQRYREELMQEIPEIDALWGVGQERQIIDYCRGEIKRTGGTEGSELVTGHRPEPHKNNLRYRYIKIAEGCGRECRYCVIPAIRGVYRSERPDSILEKAEYAVKGGARELVLVAQDITAFGRDIGYSLERIVTDIASIQGDFWIRLLYLYPTSVTRDLLEVVKREEKVCKYLDIPLQHTEDRILRAMGRGGSRRHYLDLISNIRKQIPEVILRTTFIIGFPGESEEDFQGLCSFVKEVQFDRLGVFPYSDEEGTPASQMKHKVSARIKEERIERIMMLQAEISHEKHKKLIGKRFRTLIDEAQDDMLIARSYSHAPEIDGNIMVHLRDREGKKDSGRGKHSGYDEFVTIEITDANEYDLTGRIVQ